MKIIFFNEPPRRQERQEKREDFTNYLEVLYKEKVKLQETGFLLVAQPENSA
ncbi:MAG: hypothetical protein KME26_13225 [Oscillatoria princeps RMCB-10]|nr:hypothetical protein [Oscillatoria princeps RMCB-10]